MIIKYRDFLQDIRKYQDISVLKMASESVWRVWKFQNTPEFDLNTQNGKDMYCVRSFGPRIALLSAVSNPYRNKVAEIADVIRLSHEYLKIEETITDSEYFYNVEYPALLKVAAKLSFCGQIRDLKEVIKLSAAHLFPVRGISSQWAHVGHSMDDIERSWAILKILNVNLKGFLFKKASQYLNCSVLDFYRAGFALFSWATASGLPLGQIDISKFQIEKSVKEKYDIDPDLIRVVAQRLSLPFGALREWHNDKVLKKLHPLYQKYAPIPLVSMPLIRDVSSNNPDLYIIPSPYHLLWSLSRYMFDRLYEIIPKGRVDIRVELGNAVSHYFKEVLEFYFPKQFLSLDEYRFSKQYPDFLIDVRDRAGILVEIKNSIGPKEFSALHEIERVGEAWERLFEAFKQCANFEPGELEGQLKGRKVPHRLIGIICFHDHLTSEGTGFLSLLEQSGILKESRLEGVEIVSLGYFEELLQRYTPQTLFEIISNKWREGKGSIYLHKYIEDKFKEKSKVPVHYEHLKKELENLFPGLKRAKE